MEVERNEGSSSGVMKWLSCSIGVEVEAEVEVTASREGGGGSGVSRDSRKGVVRPKTGSTAVEARWEASSDWRARLASLRFLEMAAV